ncbi:hypothetical protein J1N35_046203, partial [Gossypium stocksii]
EDDDPMQVPLVLSSFWVPVYDLPPRLFYENVARQFGNPIEFFVEYDSKTAKSW